MSFSNAYYIPKTQTTTSSDGTKKVGLSDEFKKYQLLRIASLFAGFVSRYL